jgi:arylsulfatase A-like enzyme
MIDVMPTILDFLKLTPEKNEMQGISLARYWPDVATMPPQAAFTESTATESERKCLRTLEYKYTIIIPADQVREHGRNHIPQDGITRKLYHLETDPLERHNLLAQPPNLSTARLAARFELVLRARASVRPGRTTPVELDRDVIERLKGLGYLSEKE